MRWCTAYRGALGLRCAQYLVRTTRYYEYVEWPSDSVSVHQPGHQWGHCSVRVSFVDSFVSSRDSAFAKSSRSGLTAPTCIPRWDVSLVRAPIATRAGFSESPRYGDSIPLNQSLARLSTRTIAVSSSHKAHLHSRESFAMGSQPMAAKPWPHHSDMYRGP